VLQKHCTKPVCHRSACRRVVQQCVGMGGFLGYARVSTAEQTAALQEDALRAAGCSRIWSDTAIGTRTDRPQLVAVFDHLRVGDTLVAPNSASPPRPTPAGSSCPTPATTHQETAAIRLRATRPRRPLRNQPRRWPPRRPLHQRPAPVAKSALVRPAHRPVHPDYQCRRARRRPATTSRHPRRRHRPAAHHRQILHTYGDRPERKSLSPDGPPHRTPHPRPAAPTTDPLCPAPHRAHRQRRQPPPRTRHRRNHRPHRLPHHFHEPRHRPLPATRLSRPRRHPRRPRCQTSPDRSVSATGKSATGSPRKISPTPAPPATGRKPKNSPSTGPLNNFRPTESRCPADPSATLYTAMRMPFGNVTWIAVSTPIQAARTAPPFNTGPPPLIHRWTGIA